jgi:hypothetical protein
MLLEEVANHEALENLDPHICQRCSARGVNCKSLVLSCKADVTAFVPQAVKIEPNTFHLNLCNSCMFEFMDNLKNWNTRLIRHGLV